MLRPLLAFLLFAPAASPLLAAPPTAPAESVMANKDGTLRSPLNFFTANGIGGTGTLTLNLGSNASGYFSFNTGTLDLLHPVDATGGLVSFDHVAGLFDGSAGNVALAVNAQTANTASSASTAFGTNNSFDSFFNSLHYTINGTSGDFLQSNGDGSSLTGFAAVARTGSFTSLLGLPTTLAGYGITDGVSAGFLAAWTGATTIGTVGTIASGTWHGTPIANNYLANSSVTFNGRTVALGATGTLTPADVGAASVAATNTFTSPQSGAAWLVTTGPLDWNFFFNGDSRVRGFPFDAGSALDDGSRIQGIGSIQSMPGQMATFGFCENGHVNNAGVSVSGIQGIVNTYTAGPVVNTTAIITAGSATITFPGGLGGLSGSGIGIGGPGIPPGATLTTTGTATGVLTSGHWQYAGLNYAAGFVPALRNGVNVPVVLHAYNNTKSNDNNQFSGGHQTAHEMSPAVTGTNGVFVISTGVNDLSSGTYTGVTCASGSPVLNFNSAVPSNGFDISPPAGYGISGTNIPGSTTLVSTTGKISTGTATLTMSANATATGTITVIVTPDANAWMNDLNTGAVAPAVTDNYTGIVVETIWPAVTFNGESLRQTINSNILSTYGTIPLGNYTYTSVAHPTVYVHDMASISGFSSYNSAFFWDSLHLNSAGNKAWADSLDLCFRTIWPNQLTGPPHNIGRVGAFPYLALPPVDAVRVDVAGKSGSTYPFTYAFGSNTGPDLSVGSTHVTPNTGVGDLTHALGMNLLLNSGTVTWTSPTTLNLGATGTLTLYEKVEGPIKHVVGLLQGYTGTFTYTYPSAYLTTAPFEDDALALGTATTGSVTIRAATSTNGVIKFSGK